MTLEKWLAKLVATTVSSREEGIRRRIEDTITISQESSKTSEDQENKKRNRKGGGRQKFKNFDGDVPMCMKINDGRTGEMKKECEKTKGKGGGRRELRHVPLSMRKKGKEKEEDSSRAKSESSSEN